MATCRTWFIYRWRQILASLLIVCGLASTGSVVGWSVEVDKIAADEGVPFNMTETEQRWLVSCVGIASLFTTLGSGWLVELVGPCRLLTVLLLPQGLAWILMASTYSLPWIFVGRLVTGGIGIMLSTIIQPLLAELCQPDVRGMLSSLPEMAVSVGLLGVYIFARFLPWESSTLLCGLLLCPALFGAFFVPESPYWLIKKGRDKDAARALMKLRAPEHDIDGEIATIKDGLHILNNQQGSFIQQCRSLREGANLRPVILLVSVVILKEIGGGMFVFMYSAYFFTNAGVAWDPFTCTVLVGFTRLIFTFVLALIIDRVGRRRLLIFSSIVCACSMFTIGAVVDSGNPSVSWLPLVAALIFVACYGLGVGPIPWILIGEMLPTAVRSVGASVCTCIFALLLFLLSEMWPQIIDVAGLDDAVFAFGAFNLVLALVVWLFVPETRGRSLEDLQTAFSGAALRPFRDSRKGYVQAYGSTYTVTNGIVTTKAK